ncbi:family 43 glycosylhydrolase [Carboxylicivirga caseinilyticus]|uniref:family 43 glycosylhydrolase n=1 Tax=Carboxylicivirga caseinilyticus TaxID=3417572 RepID=UPI003D32A772|nr:family 43 glycosylhydrolase [Marinilabiliaceae bacterium A049]
MYKHPFILVLLIVLFSVVGKAQSPHMLPGNGNPLLPGYFADPTIKKFNDTYYIYATSDGVKLASGEPSVWISDDLVHWYNQEMDLDLPEGLTNCWAPDVVKGDNGKYYYYMGNCQFGCNIYGYVSDSPTGPWKPVNEGKAVIPVGTSKEYLPALDAQFFKDDDGSLYSYFGTWCTSFKGMGWVKINQDDMFTIEEEGFIPIEQIPNAFEAAYLLKKDSIYFLMYSAGDCRLSSYSVHYAWSKSPEGPWNYGKNNPILETSEDGLIHSPGHHSVLEENGEYYIVYHRHDNPHSSGGEFRQVCMDRMVFSDPYSIEKINASHEGICRQTDEIYPKNLALGAKSSATSYYHLKAEVNRYTEKETDYEYLPQLATDDNNGTIWKASGCSLPQSLVIDLGKNQSIQRVMIEFEYSTYFYQYKIETSEDSIHWNLFADRTLNKQSGCPVIDDNKAEARYIKITVTGTEKAGMYAAIWNIKVYDQLFETPELNNHIQNVEAANTVSKGLLVDFDVQKQKAKNINQFKNKGLMGGDFILNGEASFITKEGVKAIELNGNGYYELSATPTQSLNWNSPFTASAWVYVSELQNGDCIIKWNSRDNMLQASYAAMMFGKGPFGAIAHGDGSVDMGFKETPSANQWHHVAISFDGMKESIYINGKLDREMPLMLFVESDTVLIGSSGFEMENFKGFIAKVQLYDKSMNSDDITRLYKQTKPKGIK